MAEKLTDWQKRRALAGQPAKAPAKATKKAPAKAKGKDKQAE